MKFKDYTNFLSKIENINSRNEITIQISEFLKKIQKDEIQPVLYLIQGRISPKYISLEFNLSRKLLLKALRTEYEQEQKGIVSELYKQFGDVGKVAEKLKQEKNSPKEKVSIFSENDKAKQTEPLTINEVFTKLKEIANQSGKGSQESKAKSYIDLVNLLDSTSVKYISRVIIGDLRLGVNVKTILDTLSWYILETKDLRDQLNSAYGSHPDIAKIAELVIEYKKNVSINKENLEKEYLDKIKSEFANYMSQNVRTEAGIPISSKLVERESNPMKVWERMPNCIMQPKLDGLRGQLHKKGDEIFIFSRNLESMQDQFPELVKEIKNLPYTNLILDSEIIGINTENNEYLTYQETMQRKRKYEIESYSTNIPVKAMVFDILMIDNRDLTHTPLNERIKIMNKVSKNFQNHLTLLETVQAKDEKELEDYFENKVKKGLEGIITKEEESLYEAGTRNYTWIKLKANTKSELVDTLDLAILGYYIGRGKRAKHGIGALLAGVYDSEKDEYYSVGKVGSGITDEMFPIIKKDIEELQIEKMPKNVKVEKQLYPDVWLEPRIISEVIADEITRSPAHTAARGFKTKVPRDNKDKGLSIRFPRLKKWKRKKEMPTTVEELVRMFELRKAK